MAARRTIDTNGFDAIVDGGDVRSTDRCVKRGAGALVLSGALPATGQMQVHAGTLAINGSYMGSIAVGRGATLAGHGQLGSVLAEAGSTISPGLDGFGSFQITDLLMGPRSTLAIDLSGGNADSVTTTGAVIIDRATLDVRVGQTRPLVGSSFLVLSRMQGTFAGLPHDSILTTADARFRVAYRDGINNDLRLHVLDARPDMTDFTDQSIDRNTSLGPIAFTIDDAPTAPETLTVTVGSSNPSLVPPANVTVAGTGATRSLTVTPARDQSGTSVISVTVSDGTFSVTKSFTLTVRAAPVTPPPTELTYFLAEGSTGAFFDTFILIANPHATETAITLTFLKEGGAPIVQSRTLAPMSRTTIRVDDIAGLEDTAISTRVTSTRRQTARRRAHDAVGCERLRRAHRESQRRRRARVVFRRRLAGLLRDLLPAPESAGHGERRASPICAKARRRSSATTARARVTPDRRCGQRAGAPRHVVWRPRRVRRAGRRRARDVLRRTHPCARWPRRRRRHRACDAVVFRGRGDRTFFSTYILLANPNDADTDVTLTYLPAAAPVTQDE